MLEHGLRDAAAASAREAIGEKRDVPLRDHASGPHHRFDLRGLHVESEPPSCEELALHRQHRIQDRGRHKWKRESGNYHQARVENTFYRYKRIIGGRLRSREPDAQEIEVRLTCNILNRMLELGAAESYSIGR